MLAVGGLPDTGGDGAGLTLAPDPPAFVLRSAFGPGDVSALDAVDLVVAGLVDVVLEVVGVVGLAVVPSVAGAGPLPLALTPPAATAGGASSSRPARTRLRPAAPTERQGCATTAEHECCARAAGEKASNQSGHVRFLLRQNGGPLAVPHLFFGFFVVPFFLTPYLLRALRSQPARLFFSCLNCLRHLVKALPSSCERL